MAAHHQATGAGWASPHSSPTAANPYAIGMAPSFAAALPHHQPPQQQAGGWAASPHSAFQPPAAINTSPISSPVPFPGAGVSPAASYGAPSPAYGAYSPASPAFMSGPHGYATSSPMAMGAPSPLNRSGAGIASPVVTDADFAIFSAPPVVPVKKPMAASPMPVPAMVAASPVAQQAQAAPAPAPQQQPAPQQEAGWVATATPQPSDGWDNDDFGISWGERKCFFACAGVCCVWCPIHGHG